MQQHDNAAFAYSNMPHVQNILRLRFLDSYFENFYFACYKSLGE